MRPIVLRALTVALAIVGGAGAISFPKVLLDASVSDAATTPPKAPVPRPALPSCPGPAPAP